MIARLDNFGARPEAKRPAQCAAAASERDAGANAARPGVRRSSWDHPRAPWPVPPARSPNARKIAQWFGLPVLVEPARAPRRKLPPAFTLPAPGKIMLITGPSGSGKSCLLLALVRSRQMGVIDINRLRPRPVPCIDQFGEDINSALDLLNRVGLAEARTYMQLPRQLSDGQRWRLRMALGIAQAMRLIQPAAPPETSPAGAERGGDLRHPRSTGVVLVADEFCAVLDRVTAAVVARSLRRTIDRLNRSGVPISALLATSHDDLREPLLPDVIVRCDFGSTLLQRARTRAAAAARRASQAPVAQP